MISPKYFYDAISLLLSISLSIIYEDIGVFALVIFWLIVGKIFIHLLFRNNSNTSNSIFSLFFLVYLAYLGITNMLYIDNPSFTYFFNNDSIPHYNWGTLLASKSEYIGPNIFDINSTWVKHGSGFFLLSFFLSRIALFVGSDYPLIVQMTQITFLTSFLVIIVYNLLLYFVPNKLAYKATIYFGIFSPIAIYSAVYMRDMHIAVVYALSLYIFMKKFSFYNVLFLTMLCFLAFLFRPQNGFLLFIVPFCYLIYQDRKSVKGFFKKTLRAFLIIVFSFIFLLSFTFIIGTFISPTMEQYSLSHEDKYESAEGLSSYIAKLPKPLQGVANVAVSQINPFPVYRGVHVVGKTTKEEPSKDRGRVQYLSFPRAVGALFWFLVWMMIIKISFKKFMLNVPKKLRIIFLMSIVIIFSVGFSSPEDRRMLGVFPGIFLMAVYNYNYIKNYTNKNPIHIISDGVLIYLILHLLYFFLKI